jgi:ubiquinone biosynthesis protein
LGGYLVKGPLYKIGIKPKQGKRPVEIKLRELFEDLGPTFIKFGQSLSMQHGKIPERFCREFEKLQDKVQPIPYWATEFIIENEFGKSINLLFKEFDNIPLATASLSQVHKAKLHDGRIVAVKVQIPFIDEKIKSDISLMRLLSKYMNKSLGKYFDFDKLVDELEDMILKEIDFEQESKNMYKLRESISSDPDVIIPIPFEEYTTKKVLTMEYLEGIKITNIEEIERNGLDKKEIIKKLINSIFMQIFVNGIHHGDPHPANIYVLKDGRIAFLDIGVIGFLDEKTRNNVKEIIILLYQGKAEEFLDAYLRLNNVKLEEVYNYPKLKEEIIQRFDKHEGTYLDLFFNMFDIIKEYKVKIINPLTLLTRTFISINSICKEYSISNEEFMSIIKVLITITKVDSITEKIMSIFLIKNMIKNVMLMDDFIKNSMPEIPRILDMQKDRTINVEKEVEAMNKKLLDTKNAFSFFIVFIAFFLGGIILNMSRNPDFFGFPASHYFFALSGITVLYYLIKNRKKN